MSIATTRTCLIRAVKLVGIIVVFSITVEVCARIDDAIKFGAPFWSAYSNECLRSTDEAGFPVNLPNARFEKWQHNSLGFRGPEIDTSSPSGRVRVVCVGSSESYGLYESPGKEWPSQLQDILPPRYEVINASVVGLNLRSFPPYLKKHVFPLRPDVIVLVVNPLFYVTSMQRCAQSTGQPATLPPKKTAPVPVPWKCRLMANCRSFPKLKQALKQSVAAHFPSILKKYQLHDTQKQVEAIERMRLKGKKPLDLIPETYINGFRQNLAETVDLITSQGIKVLLTTYPSLVADDNMGKYPEIFLDNRRFCIELSIIGILYTINRSNKVVRDMATEKNTMFMDAASLVPKNENYFADNVHYTDKGSRIIAENIANQLQMYSSGNNQLSYLR